MEFGYRAKLAVILATAAICRTHGQSMLLQPERADTTKVTSALVINPQAQNDSATDIKMLNPKKLEELQWQETPDGKMMVQAWQRLRLENGFFEEVSPQDIENLQQISRMDRRIVSFAEGLSDYEFDGEDMLLANADSMSIELERSARREANGNGGECYKWVKHILMGTNPLALLEGEHAQQGAQGLRESPNFVEIKTEFEHMDKIVPGGVAVFGRGPGAFSGHILIGGAGPRDVVKEYTAPNGKKYQYRPAKDISDKYRNANTTGNRGSVGKYAPKPQIFLTKNTTLGLPTLLKVGVNYLKKHTGKIFFDALDVQNALDSIFALSWHKQADKITKAQQSVKGFMPAENQTAYNQYPAPRLAKPIPKRKVSGRKTYRRGGRGRA